MDKFAKRLQSRLSAKGHRFTKEECRQALIQVSLSPLEPSEEEMILAFDRLVASIEIPEETQAIAPIQNEEIIQAQDQEPAPEIEEPKSEESSLTVAENSSQMAQAPVNGISPAQVTQAISQAAHQVGVQGDAEAIQALTSLAQVLSTNNRNTQDMVAALVSGYLGERQRILSSAIGTLNSLRSAQTESFQSGLDEDFFRRREQSKSQFLNKINAMFS